MALKATGPQSGRSTATDEARSRPRGNATTAGQRADAAEDTTLAAESQVAEAHQQAARDQEAGTQRSMALNLDRRAAGSVAVVPLRSSLTWETTPVEPWRTFEFTSPGDKSPRCELSLGGGKPSLARVSWNSGDVVELRLTVVRGSLQGEGTTSIGSAVRVEFNRHTADMTLISGKKTFARQIQDDESRAEFLRRARTLCKQAVVDHVGALGGDTSVTPAQRQALEAVAQLEEGPKRGTSAFLDEVAAATDLTAAEAAEVPFLYALATAPGELDNTCESLAQNARLLAERHRGTAAATVLERTLAEYDRRGTHDHTSMLVLFAGIDGARMLAARPHAGVEVTVQALMAGFAAAGSRARHRKWGGNSDLAALGRIALRTISDVLPEDNPVRAFLGETVLSDSEKKPANVAMTRNALAFGAVQRWCDAGDARGPTPWTSRACRPCPSIKHSHRWC
jgi:hypothetical protein